MSEVPCRQCLLLFIFRSDKDAHELLLAFLWINRDRLTDDGQPQRMGVGKAILSGIIAGPQ